MRVLHVLPDDLIGGSTVVAQELTKALAQSDICCEIATTDGFPRHFRSSLTGSERPPGVPVHCFPARFPSCWWHYYSPSLSQFLHDRVSLFDLIHIHGLWYHAGYAASRVARRHGVPYIFSIHGALEDEALRYGRMRKHIYLSIILNSILRSAAAIHCLTEREKDQVERLGVGSPDFIVPNGISSDFSTTLANVDSSEFLSRHPCLVGRQIILFMGRVSRQKGIDILLHSFHRIAARFPNTVLLVAGPDVRDGTMEKIETILGSMGQEVRERVVFVGPLTGYDRISAYACADIFVLPSRFEGFSLSILEALMARLPVVISNHCHGIKSRVVDAAAGLVAPAKDEPFAAAMTTLLADRSLMARMAQNGRELSMLYTWPTIARSMIAHYSEIITQHRC